MKTRDLERRKNEKLNDLEEEAKEKAEYLLTKANEMRQEQEDEIKHLNEVKLWPCQINKIFERKIVNIFLPISFNICFGCQSTHNICFGWETRKCHRSR